MAVKKAEEGKCKCMSGMKGLYFLGAILFGALGFASIVQGLVLQWNYGFLFGFFAYLIGLLFMGAAKCLNHKIMESCCPDWRMMKH